MANWRHRRVKLQRFYNKMALINQAPPKTLAEHVIERIREDVLSGKFAPGERLDQAQLAQSLGVSLIPVREGLRQLESEGLVRLEPRRGAFVAERSADEVREISRIREALESLATQLAVPKLNPAQHKQLLVILKSMELSIQQQDMPTYHAANREFHFAIYDAAQSPLLMRMIQTLWERNRLYRQRNVFVREQAQKSLDEHTAIYTACLAQNVDLAGNLMREHVRDATEQILAKLAK